MDHYVNHLAAALRRPSHPLSTSFLQWPCAGEIDGETQLVTVEAVWTWMFSQERSANQEAHCDDRLAEVQILLEIIS
jgi:hypothetical protein